tara:strand:+ start:44 stop:868 length:825 start_codon:yes stop_codon:yes gene_type:complete
MSKPSTRQGLIDYSLRRLGYPVLEINVDDDQIDDLVDDALQYFQERHFDGIERTFLKHKVTLEEKTILEGGASGITTSTATTGVGVTTLGWQENYNFLQLPDHVIGVEKVFKMDNSTISSGLFNLKYQLFLNDLYYYGALDLLNYTMTKTYMEDLSRLITPDIQIRFNKKQHRLYMDIDWKEFTEDQYIILDCYRIVDPANASDIYNDFWLKRYLTAIIKKQWGQNLIKFQGVMLPGGVQLNGRQIYDDAVKEIEQIEYELRNEYELPPLDMIG